MPENVAAISTQKKAGKRLKAESLQLEKVTGQLLETSGVMHSFAQSLNVAGFREYVDYLGSPFYNFFLNLLAGIARGFGFVLGATVVVALFAYVLGQYLVDLPVVGEFFRFIQQVITDPQLQQGVQNGQLSESLGNMFNAFKANVLGGGK